MSTLSSFTVPSPCVGLCSTTSFGETICRGCKRRDNEVKHWLVCSDDMKQAIINRLANDKKLIFFQYFSRIDEEQVLEKCRARFVRIRPNLDVIFAAWELLRDQSKQPIQKNNWGMYLKPEIFIQQQGQHLGKLFSKMDIELYKLSLAKFSQAYSF